MSTKPLLLHFDAGLRQHAQAAADADYRGNLTAYLNALIKADAQRRARRVPPIMPLTKSTDTTSGQ